QNEPDQQDAGGPHGLHAALRSPDPAPGDSPGRADRDEPIAGDDPAEVRLTAVPSERGAVPSERGAALSERDAEPPATEGAPPACGAGRRERATARRSESPRAPPSSDR